MASDNQLLGSGKAHVLEENIQVAETFERMLMFHKNHPEGQVVKERAVFDKLMKEGWVDHPGKCTLLPGLEKYYEGEEKEEEKEEVEKSVEITKLF